MSSDVPNFLVVDDDTDTRNLMGTLLTSLGCTVQCVASGEEALSNLGTPEQANRFDAIFLDVMMPGLNGYEVSEKIRAMPHGEHLPVIMLTAKESYSDVLGGYSAGADYYITKPITRAQLTYSLDLLLNPGDGSKNKEPFFLPEA